MKERLYNIDLGAHLAQCDGNYLRLTRLMPNLRRSDQRTFRVVFGTVAPAVTLEVLERSRYTTVVAVSQAAAIDELGETRLKVRLYHDIRSAEVIEFQGQRRFSAVYPYPNPRMRQPDEKAQVNRFLGEFLNACLKHGVAHEELALIET